MVRTPALRPSLAARCLAWTTAVFAGALGVLLVLPTAAGAASARPAAAPMAPAGSSSRDVARRVVLHGSGDGGWVLDARGPVQAFGNASPLTGAPNWGNWRIARDLVVNASGTGGYLLDGWGGIHRLGDAAPSRPGPRTGGAGTSPGAWS